ncbi:MAG: RNA polymerase sigma factor [Verrucomicrobiota bacterium]
MNENNPLEFETVVETFYSSLFRFGISLAGNEADASDLTQQTFLIWANKGEQLRDQSKVKTWLFTTLYREFLRSRRREKNHPSQSLDEMELEIPDGGALPSHELDGQKVLEILKGLDETYREPLTLFYLEDLSYKEIAEILEVPIGTVMSRLSRGKGMLRQGLEAAS